MDFKIGDYVTRKSHNNDLLFKIKSIDDKTCILEGVNIRLIADSSISDLIKSNEYNDDFEILNRIDNTILNRDDYFYMPGKILHIDSDQDYLNRCMNYYKKVNIEAKGILLSEDEMSYKIIEYLNKYKPDILVITGHDAYNSKFAIDDISSYKNSLFFVKSIQEARKYEKSQEKLIIVAGGCQSNYEALIKAGANFASSPKRVNIHALDPAIIASTLSLSDITMDIDLKNILSKTKYGSNGIGGIKTKGTMYIGYPR